MPASAPFRDGLSAWHHEHVFVLLTELLSYRYNPDKLPEARCPQLITQLSKALKIAETEIAGVCRILTVCRTSSGASFHRRDGDISLELAINFSGLEAYETGAEFEEYAAFAEDPVIGSRWVQNVDEALLITLGHELAHYLVTQKYGDAPPHGEVFQDTYRLVRAYGVNPILDEFAASAAQRAATRHEQRLIGKIQALRKMAEDPTSNSHEAERALVQLQSLLEKYGLDNGATESEAKPHFIERGVPVLARDRYKPLLQVCFSIANFCGVEAVIHTSPLPTYGRWNQALGRKGSIERVTYFGAAADVEMAVYLSEVSYQSVFAESDRYRASDAYRAERARGHHPRTLLFSFRREFVERLNRRLREARESIENEWLTSRSDGKALVTKRDQSLRDALKRRYPRLRAASQSKSAARSVGSAASAGRSAADQINLNRPLNRSPRRALPGRR